MNVAWSARVRRRMRTSAVLLAIGMASGCLFPFVPPLELAACDDDARAVRMTGALVRDPSDAPFRLAIFLELFPPNADAAMEEQVDALREEIETGALAALAPPGTFALDVFHADASSQRSDGRMLASCKEEDELGGERPFWRVDTEEAWRHAPDVDAIVVVINSVGARANARHAAAALDREGDLMTLSRGQGRTVVMGRFDERGTLTHELGHALFDLGDEYADTDRCLDPQMRFADPNDLLTPNLTLDPQGERFAPFGVEAREGGARHAQCVFHPAADCVMHTSLAGMPFCPVCEARIAEVLVRHTADDVSAPRCQLSAQENPELIAGDQFVFEIAVLDESAPVSALVTMGDRAVIRVSSELPSARVLASLDADDLSLAPAQLTLQCSDRLGNLSAASFAVGRAPL